jgi:rSAM/selenodomain-associated transferase 1
MFRTVPPPQQRLLIFARVPELGRVKTRLAADVGEERALAIYEAMLHDALQSVDPVEDRRPRLSGDPAGNTTGEGAYPPRETEVEILWAPTAIANGDTLHRAFGDRVLAMQTGETLSERLAMAFSERFFFQRTLKIVAIGVDDPTLSRALIDDAFMLLDSVEWVVGPAVDGGYYLIGCRGATFDVEVFTGIEWGTSRVLAQTLERIADLNATVALLPERRDIDVAEDLDRVEWKLSS